MFDSHAHVLFDSFDSDREEVINRAREAGLSGWLEIATDVEGSNKAIAFAQQHEGVYATVGVHPSDIANFKESDWAEIEELLRHPKVVAVGEVGLDYYRGGTKEEQLPILQRFIALAITHQKPVVFHVRDGKEKSAHQDMIEFLHKYREELRPAEPWRSGVMHTFSGNQAQAEAYLELGMYLSFSGVVTFKNAGGTADVARTMPLDRLLIETDSPFLAPEPYRGKRNEPAYVKLVAEKIAQLRGISVEEVDEATSQNVKQLLYI